MSAEETMESSGYKCPYCEHQTTCDDWGFDYDGEVTACYNCEKKFTATADHSVSFIAAPSCELNGGKCECTDPSQLTNSKIYYCCDVCDSVLVKEPK